MLLSRSSLPCITSLSHSFPSYWRRFVTTVSSAPLSILFHSQYSVSSVFAYLLLSFRYHCSIFACSITVTSSSPFYFCISTTVSSFPLFHHCMFHYCPPAITITITSAQQPPLSSLLHFPPSSQCFVIFRPRVTPLFASPPRTAAATSF